MLEDQFYISKLITGHVQGNLDVQQQKEFADWIATSAGNRDFLNEFYNEAQLNDELKIYNDLDEEFVWNKIVNGISKKVADQPTQSKRLPLLTKFVAAASLILVVGLVFYLISRPKALPSDRYANDIAPGGNKAILKLSNGKQIVLTGTKTGMLANESNVSINKSGDGTIVYNSANQTNVAVDRETFNVLETPKGGKYTIGLADGTKITMNAASSLKFPVSFKGAERVVELTGEAYFEVAKDKTHPFIVKTGKESIQVLGTHFNVNNYADEGSVKTTLLEGSVMINDKTILKPGEQAVLSATGLRVNQVDTDLATAWKNNKFMFESEKIEHVMKMIERWYDVEVVYEGERPDDKFGGSVSRFDKVSKVLGMLELTGNVHFKIEGRRIIVTK
jgi:transmembrane sensor